MAHLGQAQVSALQRLMQGLPPQSFMVKESHCLLGFAGLGV